MRVIAQLYARYAQLSPESLKLWNIVNDEHKSNFFLNKNKTKQNPYINEPIYYNYL